MVTTPFTPAVSNPAFQWTHIASVSQDLSFVTRVCPSTSVVSKPLQKLAYIYSAAFKSFAIGD